MQIPRSRVFPSASRLDVSSIVTDSATGNELGDIICPLFSTRLIDVDIREMPEFVSDEPANVRGRKLQRSSEHRDSTARAEAGLREREIPERAFRGRGARPVEDDEVDPAHAEMPVEPGQFFVEDPIGSSRRHRGQDTAKSSPGTEPDWNQSVDGLPEKAFHAGMRIVIHVHTYYDWEPVPTDVQVTEADIKARRVKPASNGGWVMRVTKKGDTHTQINLPEHQIAALIVEGIIRDKVVHSRADAIAHYLSRHVMPHHAHRNWMKAVETDDDGPDAVQFRALIDRHVEAGNIESEDVDGLVEAYLRPAEHARHISNHFGIKGGLTS